METLDRHAHAELPREEENHIHADQSMERRGARRASIISAAEQAGDGQECGGDGAGDRITKGVAGVGEELGLGFG